MQAASTPAGLFADKTNTHRCAWCQATPFYRQYHDTEWGFPVADERRLFEKICLEGFQAGLSWLTILNKRENLRRAFANFEAEPIVSFADADVKRLLADAGIVRHAGKIASTINHAQRVIELRREFGWLGTCVWRMEPDPAIHPRITAISTVWLAMISSAICRSIGLRPMNQHRPRHIRHAFVVQNHHRQKIGVGLTGVAGAVHVLHHAGHAGVHVGLETNCLRVTAGRRVFALVPGDRRYRRPSARGCRHPYHD